MKKKSIVLILALMVTLASLTVFNEACCAAGTTPSTDSLTLAFEKPALKCMHYSYEDLGKNVTIDSISVYTFPSGTDATVYFMNNGKRKSDNVTDDSAFIRVLAHSSNKFGVSSNADYVMFIRSYNTVSKYSDADWKNIFNAWDNGTGTNKEHWAYAIFYSALEGGAPFTESTLDLDYLTYRFKNGGDIW